LSIADTLELSNAMAALNCMAIGARGGISTLAQAQELMRKTERRVNKDYEALCRKTM
jgi:sulfofructose kinase